MSLRISGIPNTVAELVALQNYVIECRDVTMYNIKEKMRQTVEYVLFLMDYAHLSCKLSYLNIQHYCNTDVIDVFCS